MSNKIDNINIIKSDNGSQNSYCPTFLWWKKGIRYNVCKCHPPLVVTIANLPPQGLRFKPNRPTCPVWWSHRDNDSLSVFQDRIYWTDRDRSAVFMANRLTGQDIHTLAENLNDPHDIVVFHQLRQPQGLLAPCE